MNVNRFIKAVTKALNAELFMYDDLYDKIDFYNLEFKVEDVRQEITWNCKPCDSLKAAYILGFRNGGNFDRNFLWKAFERALERERKSELKQAAELVNALDEDVRRDLAIRVLKDGRA